MAIASLESDQSAPLQIDALSDRAFEHGISPLSKVADLALTIVESETSEADRSQEVYRLWRNPATYEVTIESDVSLEDYQKITRAEDWSLLQRYAKNMQGKTIAFINPTMEGGGVVMMRPPLVHLLRQLGVDAHWYVMEGQTDPSALNPFLFTKQMHNIIQRRLPPDERITEEGKALHQQWAADNAAVLERQEPLQTADIIIIDDPQPTPLISRLKAVNPTTKIVWRNHIDNNGPLMMDPSTPQGEVWQYLRDDCGVGLADAYVFHPDPKGSFIPPDIYDKTFLAPATTEPHDDMNRPLNPEQINDGLAFINNEITTKNQELGPEDQIELVDPDADWVAMVARFDESKGGDKFISLGVRTKQLVREKLATPGTDPDSRKVQVIFIGNGSVDDPSGKPEFNRMLSLRRGHEDKKDIILARIKHNYEAINAFMHKRPSGAVHVGAQMSDAEGCETRISDWMEHGIPVAVSSRGGMPFQVIEGKSGIILDYDKPDFDIERAADFISELIVNPEGYRAMSASTTEASKAYNQREYTTSANATRWLRVFSGVLTGTEPDKLWKIGEIVELEPELTAKKGAVALVGVAT